MRRAVTAWVTVIGALLVAGCNEELGTGAACPALCPDEVLATRDTVLAPVVFDTTLAGYPGTGREGVLPLAERGDTLATRVLLRFDTIPSTFTPAGGTATAYSALSAATLVLPVDSARTDAGGAFTVDAYDVDATATDTASAVLLPLFRADRLLGRVSYASRTAVGDTIRVPLDPAVVLTRIRDGRRLRVGLQLRSAGSAQVNIQSTDAGAGAALRLVTPADTAVQNVAVNSRTPLQPAGAATELADFVLVVRGRPAPDATRLAAGGIYGRRGFLQFAVPPSILDSATVVRATLELTQAPNRSAAEAGRPVVVYVQPVTAGQALADTLANGALRDPARIASLLCTPTARGSDGAVFCPTTSAATLDAQFRLDSIVRAPRDSGIVRVEMANLIRVWQASGTPASARVLVLRAPLGASSTFDSQRGGDLFVFSTDAPTAVRPRLRLTYVTRSSYALP